MLVGGASTLGLTMDFAFLMLGLGVLTGIGGSMYPSPIT